MTNNRSGKAYFASTFILGLCLASTGIFAQTRAGLPEWETTAKLRYAPPTLVAPTVVTTSTGYTKVDLAADEDAIIENPGASLRARKLCTDGGRNVRIIGGDFGTADLQPMHMTQSLFLEGLKFDHAAGLPLVNGEPVDVDGKQVHDTIHVVGVAPSTPVAPNVYVQNCHIAGVHGTNRAFDKPVALKSVTYAHDEYTIETEAPHNLKVEQNILCGPTTELKLNRTYTVTEIVSPTQVKAQPRRGDKTNAPNADVTGTGGYLWGELAKSGLHADGYQCNDNSIQNIVHFYKVTFDVGYQGFIGGHASPDNQARGLKMTRVNIRANNVWPRNDRSMLLYLGDTDQQPSPRRKELFPIEFDRVYLRPRPGYSIASMIFPGPNSTRSGQDISVYSDDKGQTARWREGFNAKGCVTLSEDGFSGEAGFKGKDYADLKGPNAPGLNYVSPGYSSDAVKPLVMTAITNTAIKLAVDIPADGVVTRFDVTFSGDGHIIDLVLTDDADGRFALHGRNLVRTNKGKLEASACKVTVKALQRGHEQNAITKTVSLAVQ